MKWRERKNRYKALLNHYGGKSKIAHYYPEPEYDTIIEPFAGGASYALAHHSKNVILFDRNDKIAEIWKFALSDDALYWVECLPDEVTKGDILEDIIRDVPKGLLEIARATIGQGSYGTKSVRRRVTSFGARSWNVLKPRLRYWLPRIHHWKFVHGWYCDAPDVEATWFIDPPYKNVAGRHYLMNQINYDLLALWCKSRSGQVIVCEGVGADWLSFRPWVVGHGVGTRKSEEWIYYSSDRDLLS